MRLPLYHLNTSPGCTVTQDGILDARALRADGVCGMALAGTELFALPDSEKNALRFVAEAEFLERGEAGVGYAGFWLGIRPGFPQDVSHYPFWTWRITVDGRVEWCKIEAGEKEDQTIYCTTSVEGERPTQGHQFWHITAWADKLNGVTVVVLGLGAAYVGTWRLPVATHIWVLPYAEDARAAWEVSVG